MKKLLRVLSVILPLALALEFALAGGSAHALSRIIHRTRSTPAVVRTVTPTGKASPDRVGLVSGHAGSLTTVGLGDSVPAGTACDGCTTYVDEVGDALAERLGVSATVHNEAVSGYTTADVLTQLESVGTTSLLKDADLAIVTIGANDFDIDEIVSRCAGKDASCFSKDVDSVVDNVTTVLRRTRARMTRTDAVVVVTGYWNVGEDGSVARSMGSDYVSVTNLLTRTFNERLQAATAGVGAIYVDVWTPFKGADGTRDDTDLLAADGDHPSQ